MLINVAGMHACVEEARKGVKREVDLHFPSELDLFCIGFQQLVFPAP